MDSIMFNNQIFPVRKVEMKEYGNVLISTALLNTILMKEDGNYLCEEARIIDEQIFYFIEPEEIHYSENSLTKLLIHQVI